MDRSKLLVQARKAAGLSQQQLAVETGMSLAQISKLEQGASDIGNLSADRVAAISKALKVSIYYLLDLEDPSITEGESGYLVTNIQSPADLAHQWIRVSQEPPDTFCQYFDKNEYERITGVHIPDDADWLEAIKGLKGVELLRYLDYDAMGSDFLNHSDVEWRWLDKTTVFAPCI